MTLVLVVLSPAQRDGDVNRNTFTVSECRERPVDIYKHHIDCSLGKYLLSFDYKLL